MLFSVVMVPVRVEEEFLSSKNYDRDERFQFLNDSFSRLNWLEKCNTFDPAEIMILSTDRKMHSGEIEVIAQTKKLSIDVYEPESLISGIDEKHARRVAIRNSIRVMGVLKTLAILHFNGFIDYNTSIEKLKKSGKRFSPNIIQEVYMQTEREIAGGAVLFQEGDA